MSAGLPRAARDILDSGTLCYLAVRTTDGPHLTPVVYVLDGGRIWFTTSRSSTKARALRSDREVAGMVRVQDRAVTFRGRARTYDALDPLSWPSAAVAGPRLVRATTRFSVKNARFFAGYAVDARSVPFAWTPPGRVFVGIELEAGSLLDVGQGAVVGTWGDPTLAGTGTIAASRSSFANLPPRRALDLLVPRAVRSAVGGVGEGVIALETGTTTVLPTRWRRVGREGSYDALLPRPFLELTQPVKDGVGGKRRPNAALAIDRLAAWRAAEMTGMLVQADAEVYLTKALRRGKNSLLQRIDAARAGGSTDSRRDGRTEFDPALIRLRPLRVVWWRGWSTGSVRHR